MINRRLYAEKQQLDHLFNLTGSLPGDLQGEIQSHMSRYLCVRVSGLVETAVREIFGDYAYRQATTSVKRYVDKTLDSGRSRNMNCDALLKLADSFDEDWCRRLKSFVSENGRREALDSIVNIRNNVSHGGAQNISLAIAKDYYRKVIEIINFLNDLCAA